MARAGINRETIIRKTAAMVNEHGMEGITLKQIANELGIQTPSLYNHIESLNDLKKGVMNYGWKELEKCLIHAIAGVGGYDALREMCYAFYEYATQNPGVFHVMLWYNKFQDEEAMAATDGLFDILFRIMGSIHISEENTNHLIRTFRSLLEGYCLLLNNGAFGNPISTKESFDLSVEVMLAGIQTLENQ